MKNYTNKAIFITILFLLMTSSTLYADLELVITPYRQWGSKTCWAAVSVMVLNAYGYSQSDEKIVRCWAYPYPNQSNCDCSMNGQTDLVNDLYGSNKSVESILSSFGSIIGHPDYSLAQEEISDEINGGRPFICGLANSSQKHMVLARGYKGSGGSNVTKVIYNDPSTGMRTEMPYLDFMANNTYVWLESFLLTTNPRTPILTGFYDWCQITNGTTTITPSTTSLTYTAALHSVENPPAHPVSWSWKLLFVHTGGNCVVNSWTSTSTSSTLTWNISNFSLPSGYQWYYTYFGKIPGRVELELVDSDGYHHLDAIDVQYAPNNLYPGNLVYENKTVSGTQSEVKAHQTILTQDDQFLLGGNITFRAGEKIDIKDGITIQNGSTTNFTIDPSVR